LQKTSKFGSKPPKSDKEINQVTQLEMHRIVLVNFINPEHELCQVAHKIDWDQLGKDLTPFYSEVGRLAVPVRTIVDLLLLH
jgi:hypothetical protein